MKTDVVPIFRGMDNCYSGFSFVELVVVLALIGILLAIAIPTYSWIVDKAKVSSCMADLKILEKDINAYIIDRNELPDDLNVIGRGNLRDPWGRPFFYYKISKGDQTRYKGFTDDDKLNIGFDLYSKGKDGLTAYSTAGSDSQDDIIYADDGRYIGLGSEYY